MSLNFRSYKYISPKKSECRSDLHIEVEPQWCTAMCIDALEHILHTLSDCAMKECVSLAGKLGSWINYVIPVKWQSVVANGSLFVPKYISLQTAASMESSIIVHKSGCPISSTISRNAGQSLPIVLLTGSWENYCPVGEP